MAFPKKARFVVIGAGIHGLSTAWHLAEKLKKKNGNEINNDIVVIDKGGIASGASGIACGVVRNNYFQPAMRELMMHSVNIWESDPKTFSYHPVGYMQISPESMRKDVTSIYEQQKAIDYESEFIEGKEDCMKYMKNIFYDWQAKGITSVLHEKRGGYANNILSHAFWTYLHISNRMITKIFWITFPNFYTVHHEFSHSRLEVIISNNSTSYATCT